MTTVQEKAVKDFWARTDKQGADDCWEWTGARYLKGYGYFLIQGKQQRAHRFSYELHAGPIPGGLVIDHLCRNKRCVNPAHLEVVTNKENVLRGTSFAAQNSQKTHCPKGHPYSGDNLMLPARGGRLCRTCKNQNRVENRRRERKAK